MFATNATPASSLLVRQRGLSLAGWALVYLLAHQIAFFFPPFKSAIMMIWPAAGVGLAAFLLSPRAWWPALTGALFVAGIVADVFFAGRSLAASLGYMTANMAESLACAWIILASVKEPRCLTQVREVIALVTGAVLVNAVTACLGAETSVLANGSVFTKAWSVWFISDGLGLLLVAPFIVSWLGVPLRSSGICGRTCVEAALFLAAWCLTCAFAFNYYSLPGQVDIHPYSLLGLLACAGLRLGLRSISLALLLLFIIALGSPAILEGPLNLSRANDLLFHRIQDLEVFLAFLAGVGYLLSAAKAGLLRLADQLQQSEAESRDLFEVAAIGMAQANPLTGQWLKVNLKLCEITGYSEEEMLRLRVPEITHPDDRQRDWDLFQQVIRGERNAYEIEKRYVRKDGTEIWVRVNMTVRRDERGIPLKTVASIEEITGRKQTEAEIQDREERLRSYFDSPLIGIAITSLEKGWLEVNSHLCTLLGYSREQLTRMNWEQLTHPEDLAADLQQFNRVVAGEIDAYALEKRFLRADGQAVPCELGVRCVRHPDGRVKYFVTLIQDLTERKQAEQALRRREEIFAAIAVQASDAIVLIDPPTGRFLEFNEAAHRDLGYTREEFARLSVGDIQAEHSAEEIRSNMERIKVQGHAEFETRHRHRDGSIRIVNVRTRQLTLRAESFIASVWTDITERKQALFAMEREAQKNLALLRSASDGIHILDTNARLVEVSDSFCQMLGYERHEMLGMHVSQWDAAFSQAEVTAKVREQLECASRSQFESIHRRKDGGLLRVEISGLPVKIADHTLLFNSARDITARKQAEEKLRESETLLREAQLIAGMGSYVLNVATGRWSSSEGMDRVFGIDHAYERTVAGWSALVHPDDRAMMLAYFTDEVLGRRQPFDKEYRIIRQHDQAERWLHGLGRLSLDAGGHPVTMHGIIQDITERKQAEAALQRLNRELSAITACNQALVRAVDEVSLLNQICRIVCGTAGYRMAWVGFAEHDEHQTVKPVAWGGVVDGYLNTSNVTWSDTDRGRGPTGTCIRTGQVCYIDDFETHPNVAPWLEAARQRGYRCSIGLPLIDEKGHVFGALTIYSALPNAFTQEEIRLLTGLADDLAFGISNLRVRAERKQAEEALRESERRLVHAQAVAHVGNWELDLAAKTMWASAEAFRIYGLAYTSPCLPLAQVQQMVLAEDRPRMDAALSAFLQSQTSYDHEYRIRRANDHEVRVVHTVANLVSDAQGVPAKLVGVIQDITERKQMEEAVRKSERLHRTILANLPDPAWMKDAAGRFAEVNQAWCQATGLTREQALGHTDAELFPPELAARFVEQDRTVVASGQMRHWEETVPDGRGGFRSFETFKAPALDTAGAITAIIGIARDITQRKQAEDALRSSEKRLSDITFSMADWVWEVDARGVYTYSSEKGFDYFGRESVIGKTPFDFMPPEEARRVKAIFAELLVQKAPIKDLENWNIRANGERVCLLTNAVPILDQAGNLQGYRGVDKDITEHKRLQAQLLQAQKLDSIGQLAGGVAHDFNNMLAAIMMNLGLLHKNIPVEPETKEIFEQLTLGAKRAADLTRQLLLFSRRSAPQTQCLDLSELLWNMLKMLKRLIGEHIAILPNIPNSPAMVQADPGMLEQVLMNLTVNARDAMPEGGSLTINLTTIDADAQRLQPYPELRPGPFHCLAVTDTGCGMDQATMQRIFEPFFTTKEVGKGTGLGLATVHGIVAQHKGWIEVASQPGQGSTFRVYLPAVPVPVVSAPLAETSTLVRGTETILLVEDEASVRRAAAIALRRLGYAVFDAENGAAALKIWSAQKSKIALLLTDMVMPGGLSGLQLANQLRQEKPNLGIIISSGYHAEMSQREKVTASGITFFHKPYEMAALSQIVRQVLDEARAAKG